MTWTLQEADLPLMQLSRTRSVWAMQAGPSNVERKQANMFGLLCPHACPLTLARRQAYGTACTVAWHGVWPESWVGDMLVTGPA